MRNISYNVRNTIHTCQLEGSTKPCSFPIQADLYKDSQGNNIKIHFANMKEGTYQTRITATDNEGAEAIVKVPETVTVEPIKLEDFFTKLQNKEELEAGFLALEFPTFGTG